MADDVTRDRNRLHPRVRWAVWLISLAVYTYLLLAPQDWLPPWLRATVGQKLTDEFSVGKLAHAVVYGLFTLGTFVLPVGRRGWWLCVAALSAHGFATEYIQTFVPGRSGQWFDVGIDHIGIATGLLLGGLGHWLWSRRLCDAGPKWMAASQQVQRYAGREDGDASPL